MVFNGVDVQKPLISAIFTKFKLLTMLDFERYPIDRIPKELGNLLHLRYSSLKDAKVLNTICLFCQQG
jgi:disease resistance protein RPM1